MTDRDTIEQLHHALMRAAATKDAAAFARLLHPDYRTVNEDGSAMNVEEVLAEMRSPSPLEIGELPPPAEFLIRVAGDTAFVTARQTWETPAFTLDLRYLEVWVRHNGNWKFAHWQATRVTPEGLAREARAQAAAARP